MKTLKITLTPDQDFKYTTENGMRIIEISPIKKDFKLDDWTWDGEKWIKINK